MKNKGYQWTAATLAFGMLLSLSACNYAQERTAVEPGVGVDQTAAVREAGTLNDLEPGHPMGYYNEQFGAMGYEVRDVDYFGDRAVYDLVRDDEFYRVELTRPAENDVVDNVAVERREYVAGETARTNPEFIRARELILQTIQPGQPVMSYIPQLQQMGEVTEIERDAADTNIHLEMASTEYVIEMDVDPNTRVVKGVEVDEEFWGV